MEMAKKSTGRIQAVIFLIMLSIVFHTGCKPEIKKPLSGIVMFVVGSAEVTKNGIGAMPLTISAVVSEGDIITTRENSIVTLQIEEREIVVQIQENTSVSFKSLFRDKNAELFVREGEVLTKIKRLIKDERYIIKTPSAVASVRGTEFSARYNNGKSVIAVKKGQVAVFAAKTVTQNDEAAHGEEHIVNHGYSAVITELKTIEGKVELKVEIRPITESESKTIEQISRIDIVPGAEKKSMEELMRIHENLHKDEVNIDRGLNPKIEIAKIAELIKKKENTLEKIKEVFKRIDEISLYNGRIIQGAIISQGEKYKILTTAGIIDVNESDIKKVKVIR